VQPDVHPRDNDGSFHPCCVGLQFDIADYRRQKVVEIVGNPTGHLTDDFHLLCLLQGCLRLLPLDDLLMELLICLFELPGSRLHQSLQLSSRILPVQQVLPNLVLSSSSTQSCSYGADQSDCAKRPLDQ